MAFEILPDEEAVQVRMWDGVGDVLGLQAMCRHFAKKVHARHRKGSPPGARGCEHGAAEGSFFRWPIPR